LNISCPNCGDNNIGKAGKNKGFQVYFCKQCKKTFGDPSIELPFCKCGCGTKLKYPWQEYVRGHSLKKYHASKNSRSQDLPAEEEGKAVFVSSQTLKKPSSSHNLHGFISSVKRFFSSIVKALALSLYVRTKGFEEWSKKVEEDIRKDINSRLESLQQKEDGLKNSVEELKSEIDRFASQRLNDDIIKRLQTQLDSMQNYIRELHARNMLLSKENKILHNKLTLMKTSSGLGGEGEEASHSPVFITVEGKRLADTFPYSDEQKSIIKVLCSTRPMPISEIAFHANVTQSKVKKFLKMIVQNGGFILNKDGKKWRLAYFSEGGARNAYILVPEGENLHPSAFEIPARELV
jgi:predicted transcriptional regulator